MKIGAAGFEPTTSRSRTVRATICATPRNKYFKWSGRRDSNPRSLAPQASALPLSHSPNNRSRFPTTHIFYHSFNKSSSVSLISVRNFVSVRAFSLPLADGN